MTAQDPTKIDLRNDPRAERFAGVARHGMVPFDVPYITPVAENLWLGGCKDGLSLPREIVNIVSLYPWEKYVLHDGVLESIEIKAYDSVEQDTGPLVEAARKVNELRLTGETLVHCQAGLNRSSLVTAMALVMNGEGTPQEVVAMLREKRSPAVLCNKAFEEFILLRRWES